MLKLQVKEPGEYLMIGDNVKVIFTGWSKNYLRIMVDAPKDVSVVRNKAAEKAGKVAPGRYLSERDMKKKQEREFREAAFEKNAELIQSMKQPGNMGRKKKAVIVQTTN